MQSRIQKEVLEVLEKRIDKNEDHLDMLMQNDKKQDETLTHLEASLPNLDGKLKALESADEFFQVVYTSPVLNLAELLVCVSRYLPNPGLIGLPVAIC